MVYNLAGLPAAVVRCAETPAGLPLAVQVVAPAWREDIALAVAARLEQAFGGWQPSRVPNAAVPTAARDKCTLE